MINNIEIVHIVAHDLNGAIGKDNKLPWHIPTDLKHFHDITYNSIVIMGRKTFESIGKALPQRDNIVISTNVEFSANNVLRMGRIDTAIAYAISLAKYKNQRKIFIIGGSKLYEQTQSIVDTIEATLVNTEIEGADAFYKINKSTFKLTNETEKFDPKSKTKLFFKTYNRVV